MGYCTATDVQDYFLNMVFSETTSITKTKVDNIIAKRSDYIDSVLTSKYTVPLTDTKDLAIIKDICSRLVAGEIDEINNFSTAISVEVKKGRDLKKEALADLDKIISGEIKLKTPLSSVEGFDGAPEEETTESEGI